MQFLSFLLTDNNNPASPIYKAITELGPYVAGVLCALGIIYGIVLGVRLAQTDDKETAKKIQKTLINLAIGVISIVILLVVLFAIRDYI